MFQGLLPEHIIGVLTAIFELDNAHTAEVDVALLQMVCEGAPDMQDELQVAA